MREGIELPTRERFARLVRRLGLEEHADLPETLGAVHMGGLRACAEAPPSHAEVLARLSGRYRLGLCSNFSDAATALSLLDEAGLLRFFDAHAISETEGLRKPRPEIFRAVLGRLGVDPARAVHVGDHLRDDVGGAGALGLRTVWATRRVRDPEASLRESEGVRPTWQVADLAEIPGLLP
ncbi:MAG: HAD family hydrolase [Alphaproteobacteria bacterium]